MKAVIQRVSSASVQVEGKTIGSCGVGYLVLFGAAEGDTEQDVELLALKTAKLRVFEDEEKKMNRSILDVDGEILVISQFTLCADVHKGNRPSFFRAMRPREAYCLYELYCDKLKQCGVKRVEKGVFGADMKVNLINDGPVTILFDTEVWKR